MSENKNSKKRSGTSFFIENEDQQKPVWIIVLGITLSMAWVMIIWSTPTWISKLDNIFFDTLVRLEKPFEPPNHVVIVDVDENSLSAVGQWPWPRYRMGAMVNNLAQGSPAAIGIDIFFPEPDGTSLTTIINNFKNEFCLDLSIGDVPQDMTNNDAYLGQVLTNASTVGSVLFSYDFVDTAPSCSIRGVKFSGNTGFLRITDAGALICNIPPIQAGLESSGFINVNVDHDGILRRIPLIARYQGEFYPSLALALLMLAAGEDIISFESDFFGPVLGLGKNIKIPIDEHGQTLLRFKSIKDNLEYISALDVLQGNFDFSLLNEKIVLIGTSAAGLKDLHYTALSGAMPGIEAHAALISNSMSGRHYIEPVWKETYHLAGTFMAGISVSLLLLLPGPFLFGFCAFIVILFFPGLGLASFHTAGLVLPVAGPFLAAASLLGILVSSLYFIEKSLAGKRLEKLVQFKQAILELMVGAAESRSLETGLHIKRTQLFVKILALGLMESGKYPWFSKRYVELLHICSPLHDVGKIAIPDRVLSKPDKLTEEEYALMKEHVYKGVEIIDLAAKNLSEEAFFKMAKEIILTHHEKWDGSGYPNGISGENIPLSGRIMALADYYEALISPRVYKEKMNHQRAMKIILKKSGSHFDPFLVEIFIKKEKKFMEIHDNA
jgi:adenylate cyclase